MCSLCARKDQVEWPERGTADCRVLLNQAQKMRASYNAQRPEERKACEQNQELHAIVAESAQAALEAQKSKKKRESKSGKNSAELNKFKELSISETDSVQSNSSDE